LFINSISYIRYLIGLISYFHKINQIHLGILTYGNELLNSDPKKNLIFSLHMYAEWRNDANGRKIGDNLYNIQQKGLTVIVGEFTLHHPDGCKWIKVDVWELMRQCKWKNVGYIGK
jgi:mannan endo-1,4-beta-mannosidase